MTGLTGVPAVAAGATQAGVRRVEGETNECDPHAG